MTPILEVKELTKIFHVSANPFLPFATKPIPAVNHVSFSLTKGDTLGIVGETGCGKSTLGRLIVKLYPPTSGDIILDGIPITRLSESEFRPMRKKIQMIFQDPYLSLDPRMTAGEIIGESYKIHNMAGQTKELCTLEAEMMQLVGLSSEQLNRYPHEFSGGQRQRIGLARALAVGAEIIICDEPVSALDVSIQAQIINLFTDIQDRLTLTYLFISHDLAMVKYISTHVAVMYLGRFVEIASRDELFAHPLHPYTQMLLQAVPEPDPVKERAKKHVTWTELAESQPSPCSFFPRCKRAEQSCHQGLPGLVDVGSGHQVACWKR